MPLNVLVVGAGVCGPAFAALLQGFNHRHNITVIERSPSLRATGQQIDLKSAVLPVVRKMNLVEAIKSHSVAESGLELVDAKGRQIMYIGFDDANQGDFAKSVSSEYEIMRGDLVRVIYDFSLDQRAKMDKSLEKEGGLRYEFGKTITNVIQTDAGVNVTFSDGQKQQFDLVVGADGQSSRTRRLTFGQDANDEAYNSLGIYAAFYSVPRVQGEGETGKSYLAPGRRGIMTRTGDRPVTQVFLFTKNNLEKLKELATEPVEAQKIFWAEEFKGVGWESDRFLKGLDSCDDFYACELAQVRTEQFYSGRVALLGDAGYCPSVITGMGTTASIIGAYILAGELSRPGRDVTTALAAYDEIMKPLAYQYQALPFGDSMEWMWPSSRTAIWILNTILWAIANLKIDRIIQYVLPKSKEKTEQSLPEYPNLNIR